MSGDAQSQDADALCCRKLFVAVIATALADHRDLIAAAMVDRKRIYLGQKQRAVGSVEAEIGAARRYLNSGDFELLCGWAGVSHKPQRALEGLISEAEALVAGSTGDDLRRRSPQSILARALIAEGQTDPKVLAEQSGLTVDAARYTLKASRRGEAA